MWRCKFVPVIENDSGSVSFNILVMKRRNATTVNSVCLLCARDVTYDHEATKRKIFEYPDWINLVAEVVGFELCNDTSLPDTVCNGCIAKLSQYLEFRRDIFTNVIKHHINYFISKNDFIKVELCRTKIRCRNVEQRSVAGHKHTESNLIITDVRSERLPDNSYLLEPMFQTCENVLETESGGRIHAMNEEITARKKMPQEYKCQFCDKTYSKEHYYRKHMRKHNQKKCRQKLKKSQFLCHEKECGKMFDRLIELRKHMTVHGTKFKCCCCAEEFPLWYDYQWHYQICDATKRGRLENGVGQRTRSRSQLSQLNCLINDRDEEDSEASIVSTISDYQDQERFRRREAYKIRKKWRQENKPNRNSNKQVTFGILCRLDTEGKSEPSCKRRDVVGYTTKELIQKGVNKLVNHAKNESIGIDSCRQPKLYWQPDHDDKSFDAKPTTHASSTDIVEDLQVPADSFFTKPSSPIMFNKEEQDECHLSMDKSSQPVSSRIKLDAFGVFEIEPDHFDNRDGYEEPITRRSKPDATTNCLPSFDELFPKNHIFFDELRSISLKWS